MRPFREEATSSAKRRKTDGTKLSDFGQAPAGDSPYFSPAELATRWRCSRSSVDRVARRNGLRKLLLGEGKNGMVRYVRREVEELEKKSLI
jgi:hypothetical protein